MGARRRAGVKGKSMGVRHLSRRSWIVHLACGLAAMTLALAPAGTAGAKRNKKAAEKAPAGPTVVKADGSGIISGRLEPGDQTLESGEFVDLHVFEVQVGQTVKVDLYASEFDTFLAVMAPSGEATRNDDYEGGKDHSQVELVASEAGAWTAAATTYRPGELGSYSLHIELSDAAPAGSVVVAQGPASTTGRLEAGDATLDAGEYFDAFAYQLQAGQTVTADLRSSEFDTFVGVLNPQGEPAAHNDDHEGSKDRSLVSVVADVSGAWTVAVTSYAAAETGAYSLDVQVGAAGEAEPGVERYSGRLEAGDTTLDSGEYVDGNAFEFQAGEFVVVDLRSTDFDPWLEIRTPGGETFVNDDHEGDSSRSQLALTLTETGSYTVFATTYKPGDSGAYDVSIRRGSAEATPAADSRVEQGTLAAGDSQLDTGEYVDTFTFDGRPGQTMRIDLAATGFDGYLVLIPPSGDPLHNDDAPGQPGHSLIEASLSELGTYTVAVTSYKVGEVGSYTLTVESSAGDGEYTRQRDVAGITPGEELQGRLEDGDTQLDGGELVDMYVFDGQAGQKLVVEMTATDFDPYLGVLLPSGGEPIENDDFGSRRDMSRIEFQLQETGRYRVAATSFGAGVQGAYKLALQLGDATVAPVRPAGSRGQIFGVFVGISDYPGDEDDLAYTADDARNLQAAFTRGVGMTAADSVVLTDGQATMDAVREAVAQLGSRAGADDMFVFFYSGHGARQKRADTPTNDPDGMDETLMLFDGHMLDDEFALLLDGVTAGTTLLILDACFAGGFAKDVISKPGRMGMFSSEEDVTSSLADKFRAGGYLARFAADGIGDGYADDGDGQLTALELCQYVHERYRADVKSGGTAQVSDIVLTGRAQGYQHLVVDRGSVGPYQILFHIGSK